MDHEQWLRVAVKTFGQMKLAEARKGRKEYAVEEAGTTALAGPLELAETSRNCNECRVPKGLAHCIDHRLIQWELGTLGLAETSERHKEHLESRDRVHCTDQELTKQDSRSR